MSQHGRERRSEVKKAVADTQAAAKELVKDAAALAHQSAILQERAARSRAEAQQARRQAQAIRPPPAGCLCTIPEAARRLHVAERTLRHALEEPALNARLIERTRKVGIFYKFLPLLPPDLVSDLSAHFAARRPHAPSVPTASEGEDFRPPADN